MKILPQHRIGIVASLFCGAIVLYVVLHFLGRGGNDNFQVYDGGKAPFSDVVAVEPGAEYFFTWGVTASPRMQEIARSSPQNRYGDTYQQAYSVLSALSQDLAEVGLTLRDVVNVRAYIVADPEPDFAGWNQAFTQFFGTKLNPHKPARTSVGITRLFHSDYRIEVEFIAVFPDGRGPHLAGTRQHERYTRLSRKETSDRWKSYGRSVWPMSTGKATTAETSLFFSSALRPQPLVPNAPPQFQFFGNINQQSASIFKQMDGQLKTAGLGFEDVFFIRAIVYPGVQSISRSFATFNKEYQKFFNNTKNPNRPTRTVMSAPGFNYKKQSISIEYYAAYPDDSPKTLDTAKVPMGSSPAISKTASIGPAGTAISKDATILFVSGAISSGKGSMKEQAQQAMASIQTNLSKAGATLADITQIRVYIENVEPKALDQRIADWETYYETLFTKENAPAVTILPVVSLVNNSMLEVEAMAAIKSS